MTGPAVSPPGNEGSLPAAVGSLADLDRLDRAARRHEVPCGDGTMVWRRWGNGSAGAGAPVVLLHGGSGSWNHWARNIAALVAAGRRVWIPDLPGFGESARPPAGSDADALPAPMEAALQTLLGDAAVDLVGFSFGGMVGTLMAAGTPARVRRLVLTGAPALGVNPDWRLVLRAWTHLQGEERVAAHRDNLLRLMLARPESLDDLALAIHVSNLDRDRMKMRRLSRTDIVARTLSSVQCRVYGIWGAEDVLYRGVQDRLAPALASAPAFRWLRSIPRAGHWVQYEAPAAFDQALAEALSDR